MRKDTKDVLIVLAAAAGTFIAWRIWAGAGAAFNPANPENVINQGADRVLKDAGVVEENSSLGSTIYDWLNPNDEPQLRYPAPVDGENEVFR